MEQNTVSNLTDRELLKYCEEKSYTVQKQLAERFETLLNNIEEVEGGVEELKKELLTSIRSVKDLINEGELSRARTEANCLKVRVSKSTEVILNLIQGNI